VVNSAAQDFPRLEDTSESDEESEEFYNGDSGEEVPGLPGTSYGGYGRCFRLDVRRCTSRRLWGGGVGIF
jgi:hypothetical protein